MATGARSIGILVLVIGWGVILPPALGRTIASFRAARAAARAAKASEEEQQRLKGEEEDDDDNRQKNQTKGNAGAVLGMGLESFG